MKLNRFLNGMSSFCMSPDAAAGTTAGAPAVAAVAASPAPAAATVGQTVGEAAAATAAGASQATTVSQPVAQAAATSDWKAGFDDTLKKDPYLSTFADPASMAKALLDNRKLIGQKLGIPGPDATPEAKAAFHEAMGVPKDGAGYEFKAPADLPEAMKAHYDQAHADKWAGIFHKNGIPKEAATALRNELYKEVGEEIGKMKGAVETSDQQFGEIAAKIYGDNAKATEAMQNVNALILKHAPPELRAAANALPNSALLLAAAVIRGETMALTGEDKTISRDNGANGGGETVAQLRQKARELQGLPEYTSPFTTKGKAEHDRVVAEVKGIYAKIGAMGAK